MKIVCWQTILMKYPLFFLKIRKKCCKHVSSAAVVIGALRVNNQPFIHATTGWSSSNEHFVEQHDIKDNVLNPIITVLNFVLIN